MLGVLLKTFRVNLDFVYTRYLSDCDGPNLLLLESQARDFKQGIWSEGKHVLRGPGFIGGEPMQDFVVAKSLRGIKHNYFFKRVTSI